MEDKTFRIKTGVFAKDFLYPKTIATIIKKISSYPGFKFEVYTSLPGSRLNGGRPNTYVIENNCIYPLGDDHKRIKRESSNALLIASDILSGKYPATKGDYFEKINYPKKNTIDPKNNTIKELETKFRDSIRVLNSNGIGVGLALTNHFIDKSDLEDPYFQRTADFLADQSREGVKNSITYVNDKLADFLRSKYGQQLGLTASIIKFCAQPDLTYQESLKTADDVVLFHGDIFDDEVLNSIPKNKRKNVFILASTGCKLQCSKQSANQHYLHASRFNRGEIETFERGFCKFKKSENCSPDKQMFEKLIDLGYISYKFGRSTCLSEQSLLSMAGPYEHLQMPKTLNYYFKNKENEMGAGK